MTSFRHFYDIHFKGVFLMKLSDSNPDNNKNADDVANIVTLTKTQIIAPATYSVFCLNINISTITF